MERVVVVGIGQVGAIFALGWLRGGQSVVPVPRGVRAAAVAEAVPEPAVVLLATREAALPALLADWPAAWRERVALVQNDLRPPVWQRWGIAQPSVAVVWFLARPGAPPQVLAPTRTFGPAAPVLAAALTHQGIAVEVEADANLPTALAVKNGFILATNAVGWATGARTLAEIALWHRRLWEQVREEALTLETAAWGGGLDRERVRREIEAVAAANPHYPPQGRTARERIASGVALARQLGVGLPLLEQLAAGGSSRLCYDER